MIDLRAIRKAQEVRRAWDLASRVAHAAPQHFSAIERHVRARSDVGALSRVIVKLPGGAQILRTGDAEHVDIAQLDRGLLQAAPRARAHLGRALVARFATSRELEGRGSLPARFAVFLEKAGAPDWLVELAVLESWIIAARRSDPSVESLLARGPLPRRGDPFITASNAFTLVQFATDVLSVHAGREPRTRRTLLLVGKVDGAVSLVSLDVETANAWARLHRRTARLSEWAREVPRARDVLGALAAHGAVGWTRG